MPLSEDEQRILAEIEDRLYETDPGLANEVSSTTVYTDPARSLRWAIFGFVVGVAVMVGALSISYWASFVGFIMMFVAAIRIEGSMRKLGKVSIDQLAQNLRKRPSFGMPQRRPFKTDED